MNDLPMWAVLLGILCAVSVPILLLAILITMIARRPKRDSHSSRTPRPRESDSDDDDGYNPMENFR
jgi:hypothetical protein